MKLRDQMVSLEQVPLTPALPVTAHSPVTKIGIIYMYTQRVQEHKIFPMIPRSEWSAQCSLKYMHENAQKFERKLRAKLPATTHGYSMAKIARLSDAFSEVFKWKAWPVEGQSLQQKDKKRSKRRGKKS